MGGQALAGGDVGMVAADEGWMFSLAVCSWLCWVGGSDAGRAVWIKPASFRSLRASFRRPSVSSSVVVVGGLGGFVQAFGEGEPCSICAMVSSISSTLPLASCLRADEYAFTRPYGTPAVGSEFEAFAVFHVFPGLESTMGRG